MAIRAIIRARYNLDRGEWVAFEFDPNGVRAPVNTCSGRSERSALRNASIYIKKHGSSFLA